MMRGGPTTGSKRASPASHASATRYRARTGAHDDMEGGVSDAHISSSAEGTAHR